METQKIVNSLNSSENEYLKFATKKWYVIDSGSKSGYLHEGPIKFFTKSIESSFCDYSDGYILSQELILLQELLLLILILIRQLKKVKQQLIAATKLVFKNCAQFKDCKQNSMTLLLIMQILLILQCLCAV